jgi:hypothetical protein
MLISDLKGVFDSKLIFIIMLIVSSFIFKIDKLFKI